VARGYAHSNARSAGPGFCTDFLFLAPRTPNVYFARAHSMTGMNGPSADGIGAAAR
jgi:hypothetical protein